MTRDLFLSHVQRDRHLLKTSRWGESLWGALVYIGFDVRPFVDTPEDPWAIRTYRGVLAWVDRHMFLDDDSNIMGITRSILS